MISPVEGAGARGAFAVSSCFAGSAIGYGHQQGEAEQHTQRASHWYDAQTSRISRRKLNRPLPCFKDIAWSM